MYKPWKALVLTALLLLPQTRALAWFDGGHMVVAEIAYRRLSAKTKAEVDRLLQIAAAPESATFVTASCWPDDLKAQDIRVFDTWHYHDRPFSPDGTPLPAEPKEHDVVWAIEQGVRILKSKKAPDGEKARMLRFLIHFVGDIHQPLHCSSRVTKERPDGDRGGNDFKITGVHSILNLHAYWDSGIGLFTNVHRPLDADGQPVKKIADAILAEFPPDKLPQWNNLKASDWLTEGFDIARTFVYTLPENAKPPKEYVEKAGPLARRRVALAGYRLAELLNSIFD